jgi:CMP-N,N'-diacetyllegionaminic acid synthase
MKALGVIPARGGSKGIPRKNLVPLLGRPLIVYTLRCAQMSRRLHRTVLSSEDQEILAVARAAGADIPFVRPATLAGDASTSVQVVRHALDTLEEAGEHYDAVVLLEPTAPLRTAADIDAALDRLEASGADAVISVCRVDAPHPIKMQRIEDDRLVPFLPELWRDGLTRQQLPPVYALNGAVYATRTSVLRATGSLWGHSAAPLVMPPERSVNIDSPLDLALAELLLGRNA